MVHKETDITVDILPEGARPGTPNNLAPTTIGHPSTMGPVPGRLTYIQLVSLIELKLAAGRGQDEADVIQLIRANRQRCDEVKRHLEDVHASYVEKFDALIARADEEQEED